MRHARQRIIIVLTIFISAKISAEKSQLSPSLCFKFNPVAMALKELILNFRTAVVLAAPSASLAIELKLQRKRMAAEGYDR